jgi:hypothetical protein
MSEPTERDPLAAVVALEAATFRVGQLARRLLAEHSGAGLVVTDAHVFAHDDGDTTGELLLFTSDVDGARRVARALGAEPETKMSDFSRVFVFERVWGETVIDGIKVKITGRRTLSDEETAAWRAEQDQAAAVDTSAGGGDQ